MTHEFKVKLHGDKKKREFFVMHPVNVLINQMK